MKNLFKNPLGWKLLIVFSVITLFLFQTNQAQAGSVAAAVIDAVSDVLSKIQSNIIHYECKFLGKDYIWGNRCGGGGGGGGGGSDGDVAPTAESLIIATTTCTSISLTSNINNANQYNIYRDNNLITSGNAQGLSKIVYTDSNLTPQTNYSYYLMLTDAQNNEYKFLPEVSAVTQCLPQCSFNASKNQVVLPANKITLSWECQYADSCNISPGVGPVSISGTKEVTLTENTTYVLTCQNSVGSSTSSAIIKVANPKYKEVPPY